MMWDDYRRVHEGMTWGNGLVMLLVLVLFLAAIAVLAYALFRGLSGAPRGGGREDRPANHLADAERTLAERFARGELDEEEYRRRRDVLRSS